MPTEKRGKGGVSRRSFLKGAGGVTGAAIAGKGLAGGQTAEAAPEAPEGVTVYPAQGAEIELTINGEKERVTVQPSTTLLQVIRKDLELTGSKQVCDRGACGACTVILDGRSVNSCMTLAMDAIGSEVTTVEGLAASGLNEVQQAFADHDACQCGYCIPGFVVRSHVMLQENPNVSLEEIKDGLSGNICRCGTYVKIFDAVQAASKGGA